jgi:phosphoribosyl 1,2-cyclic phosphate phosphodiesterase
MYIQFLGTGTSKGIPVIGSNHPVCLSHDIKDKRLRSSIIIKTQGVNFLIDCTPDFRYQMLRSNNNMIDFILLTHEHSDHILGLDDVLPILHIRHLPIYILSCHRVIKSIQHRFSYLFIKNKSLHFYLKNIYYYEWFFINNIKITPLYIVHGNLNILGFRLNNIAYITDASYIPYETMLLLKDLDVLIINSLREYPKHDSHFILSQTLKVIDFLSPRRSYLTHISHLFGFHKYIITKLPDNVFLAYDDLIIYI